MGVCIVCTGEVDEGGTLFFFAQEGVVHAACEALYEERKKLVKPQPAPKANNLPAVWDLVLEDFKARDAEGQRKYGVRLQPHNGRDPLVDLYQELLDAVVYCRQAIFERDGR